MERCPRHHGQYAHGQVPELAQGMKQRREALLAAAPHRPGPTVTDREDLRHVLAPIRTGGLGGNGVRAPIRIEHRGSWANLSYSAGVEPHDPVARAGDLIEIMAHEDHGSSRG
jgi:hypothetical protein